MKNSRYDGDFELKMQNRMAEHSVVVSSAGKEHTNWRVLQALRELIRSCAKYGITPMIKK